MKWLQFFRKRKKVAREGADLEGNSGSGEEDGEDDVDDGLLHKRRQNTEPQTEFKPGVRPSLDQWFEARRARTSIDVNSTTTTDTLTVCKAGVTTLINRTYIVIKHLGSGTYGQVKLAFNIRDRKLYAIKSCRKSQYGAAMGGAGLASPRLVNLSRSRRSLNGIAGGQHGSLGNRASSAGQLHQGWGGMRWGGVSRQAISEQEPQPPQQQQQQNQQRPSQSQPQQADLAQQAAQRQQAPLSAGSGGMYHRVGGTRPRPPLPQSSFSSPPTWQQQQRNQQQQQQQQGSGLQQPQAGSGGAEQGEAQHAQGPRLQSVECNGDSMVVDLPAGGTRFGGACMGGAAAAGGTGVGGAHAVAPGSTQVPTWQAQTKGSWLVPGRTPPLSQLPPPQPQTQPQPLQPPQPPQAQQPVQQASFEFTSPQQQDSSNNTTNTTNTGGGAGTGDEEPPQSSWPSAQRSRPGAGSSSGNSGQVGAQRLPPGHTPRYRYSSSALGLGRTALAGGAGSALHGPGAWAPQAQPQPQPPQQHAPAAQAQPNQPNQQQAQFVSCPSTSDVSGSDPGSGVSPGQSPGHSSGRERLVGRWRCKQPISSHQQQGGMGDAAMANGACSAGTDAPQGDRSTSVNGGCVGGPPGTSGHRQRAEDWVREIAIMKKLSHPNIVRLVEVIDDPASDALLLVMEYVEGMSLHPTRIDNSHWEAVPEAEAWRRTRDVLQGLDYLHYHGIVHGDLKPANLMLDTNTRQVKIVDFGSAVISHAGGVRPGFLAPMGGGAMSCTPAFRSPESLHAGYQPSFELDMWAMGVTVFMWVFGQLPFNGAAPFLIYECIRRKDLSIPANDQISHQLKDWLSKVLEKDPAKRLDVVGALSHPWVTGDGSAPLPIIARNQPLSNAASLSNAPSCPLTLPNNPTATSLGLLRSCGSFGGLPVLGSLPELTEPEPRGDEGPEGEGGALARPSANGKPHKRSRHPLERMISQDELERAISQAVGGLAISELMGMVFEEVKLTPKQQIIRAGDPVDTIYLITQGEVEIYQELPPEQTAAAAMLLGANVARTRILATVVGPPSTTDNATLAGRPSDTYPVLLGPSAVSAGTPPSSQGLHNTSSVLAPTSSVQMATDTGTAVMAVDRQGTGGLQEHHLLPSINGHTSQGMEQRDAAGFVQHPGAQTGVAGNDVLMSAPTLQRWNSRGSGDGTAVGNDGDGRQMTQQVPEVAVDGVTLGRAISDRQAPTLEVTSMEICANGGGGRDMVPCQPSAVHTAAHTESIMSPEARDASTRPDSNHANPSTQANITAIPAPSFMDADKWWTPHLPHPVADRAPIVPYSGAAPHLLSAAAASLVQPIISGLSSGPRFKQPLLLGPHIQGLLKPTFHSHGGTGSMAGMGAGAHPVMIEEDDEDDDDGPDSFLDSLAAPFLSAAFGSNVSNPPGGSAGSGGNSGPLLSASAQRRQLQFLHSSSLMGSGPLGVNVSGLPVLILAVMGPGNTLGFASLDRLGSSTPAPSAQAAGTETSAGSGKIGQQRGMEAAGKVGTDEDSTESRSFGPSPMQTSDALLLTGGGGERPSSAMASSHTPPLPTLAPTPRSSSINVANLDVPTGAAIAMDDVQNGDGVGAGGAAVAVQGDADVVAQTAGVAANTAAPTPAPLPLPVWQANVRARGEVVAFKASLEQIERLIRTHPEFESAMKHIAVQQETDLLVSEALRQLRLVSASIPHHGTAPGVLNGQQPNNNYPHGAGLHESHPLVQHVQQAHNAHEMQHTQAMQQQHALTSADAGPPSGTQATNGQAQPNVNGHYTHSASPPAPHVSPSFHQQTVQ